MTSAGARRIHVCATSRGNGFMVDIARLVAAGLEEAGAEVRVALDEEALAEDEHQPLVVAPHEFFPLYGEAALGPGRLDRFLGAALLLNTEQPGTPWFERAALLGRSARGVIDLHTDGVAELGRRGIPALHAPLGYAEVLRAPAVAERDVDILFLGVLSERRERFFAEFGEFLSRYRCRFLFASVEQPRGSSTPGYVGGAELLRLVARSRLLLNVHARPTSYFETHRAVLAAANGCALVSETSRGTGPLEPGVHFEMAPVSELAGACAALLADEPRRAAMATAAFELLSQRHRMAATGHRILELLDGAAPPSPVRAAPASSREALAGRCARALTERARGRLDYQVARNAAASERGAPSVSVVVPLHDYERHVEAALRSVERAASPAGGHEVVVVDDRSNDRSREVVAAFMERSALPVTLVTKETNTGLGDTRNVGWRLARAPRIFFLDADNLVHERCLVALAAALDHERSAAAYASIRVFEDGTGAPLGLLSARAWCLRTLVRGPYIDAMAMFTRDTLERLGGYSTELLEHGWQGWEDYALWLDIAEAGLPVAWVPEILSSYRSHRASMIHRTNEDRPALARFLAAKHQGLRARWGGEDCEFGVPATPAPTPVPEPPPSRRPVAGAPGTGRPRRTRVGPARPEGRARGAAHGALQVAELVGDGAAPLAGLTFGRKVARMRPAATPSSLVFTADACS